MSSSSFSSNVEQSIQTENVFQASDLLIGEGKYDEAIDLLQSQSPKSSESLLKCGHIWEHYKKDLSKAIDCYKSAAELGDANAFYALGFVHLHHQHQEHQKIAIDYLETGAAKGHAKCLLLLASLYSDESNVDIFNGEKAFAYCKQSAELGESNAQVLLGTFYLEGNFVNCNLQEAKRWFLAAAEGGNAEAQYQMAANITKEPAESVMWLEKAAGQGHATALYELAMKRLEKDGNLDEAVRLLSYSCQEGNPIAQFEMFKIFSEGKLIEPNDHIAYKSCIQAAMNGHKQAIFHLGKRLIAMGQVEAGESWLRKGAEMGNDSQCKFHLAKSLLNRGESEEEALKLLNDASQQGDAEATEELKLLQCQHPKEQEQNNSKKLKQESTNAGESQFDK